MRNLEHRVSRNCFGLSDFAATGGLGWSESSPDWLPVDILTEGNLQEGGDLTGCRLCPAKKAGQERYPFSFRQGENVVNIQDT